MDGRDFAAGAVRFQARYFRVGEQSHISCLKRRHDTADMRVGFCVDKTGEAVTCAATDARAVLSDSFHRASRRVACEMASSPCSAKSSLSC